MEISPPESGLLTFVFTDVEGSTRYTKELEAHGKGTYERDLRNLMRDILLSTVRDNHGFEIHRAGDGHFFVFAEATDAYKAILNFQRQMPLTKNLHGKEYTINQSSDWGAHLPDGAFAGGDALR
jgi:class 3 adenylate cyclase